MKPYGKKTRILRAKIDTCSNTNIMPASTYKIIYNDPDCIKLQPSEKKGIQTYTKQKIPVIGSCELFVLHSDDQCFHKEKFQIVSVEGSVIISCATSIKLNLIQIPKQLDTNIPDCARLIYSSVDVPRKHQYKVQQSVPRTKSSNKKYRETHRWPQKSKPEDYSRLCSDRTCKSTRCYKINCNPKRQKISVSEVKKGPRSKKSKDDQPHAQVHQLPKKVPSSILKSSNYKGH